MISVAQFLLMVLSYVMLFAAALHSASGEDRCAVASVHPLATDAGLAAYESGGNALDAAIATALTLGVVDNHNSGLGGGCFILIRQPDGKILAIDGREKAPAAATRDMYLRDGKAVPELSTNGPLAVGVPGALAAYAHALEKCGKKKLSELILPAADIAEQGFPIDRIYAGKLKKTANILAEYPGSRAALLKADGSPYKEGEILRQPDLAKSYRQIAEQGTDWFYRGEFAAEVGKWMAANGGILTAADFAAYQPVDREPLITTYRDWKIVGFPPPSSGGVHVAQILNILEPFDLAGEFRTIPVRGTHLMLEAMKLAFADRAYWLGDSDFVDVPRGLTDKEYAKSLSQRIDLTKTIEVPTHGEPPQASKEVFGKHTTHITAADTEGYWVAITATVNTTFGSKVIVPGTGILLNDEMDDFSSQPGVPNAFGLIGAENNSIAPGKRPLSSMSPTIVLDSDDKPVLTVGAAGGPKIITQVCAGARRSARFKERFADRRSPHRGSIINGSPTVCCWKSRCLQEVIDGLKSYGHKIEMIEFERSCPGDRALVADGKLQAVHDPRSPGKAASVVRK